MKKISGIFIIAAALLCAGCEKETPNEPLPTSTPDISAAPTVELQSKAIASLAPDISVTPTELPSEAPSPSSLDVSTTEGEPIWAKGTQMDSKLFQNLNLDGIGDADDEAYVSVYQFGDYQDRAIVLRIHLGTGETMAKIFPLDGFYTFQTGKLFSEDKEVIVLDVENRTSNYSAATVFVVDVYPADDVTHYPEAIVRLDTTNSLIPLIFWDTEVIDIEGSSLQGLEIPSWDPKDKRNEPIKNIFRWDKEKREWIQSVK